MRSLLCRGWGAATAAFGVRIVTRGEPTESRRAWLSTSARRLVLAVLCAATGALACSSAPALALESHVFSSSFSGSGANALSDPQGVAIDQSTGDVYVVDSANDRVEIFSASGAFISAFGSKGTGNGQFENPTQIAIDNSTGLPGNVYVIDRNTKRFVVAGGGFWGNRVEVFNAKGEYESQITEANLIAATNQTAEGFDSIAVDASGNLWTINPKATILEFAGGGTSGRVIFSINTYPLPGLAIDSSGDLYIPESRVNEVDESSGSIGKFEANGTEVGAFSSEYPPTAVAVDQASGDLYVDQGTSVARFLASGGSEAYDSFGAVGSNALAGGAGIAVNGSTSEVYVADAARNRVDVFDVTTVAGASTEAASPVSAVAATLHGAVNPAGIPVTACQFEYGTKGGVYPNSIPCVPAVSPGSPLTGTSPVAVSAELAGLSPVTTYHYRLAATDANDTNYGGDQTLTTPPAVEGLSTGPAENLTSSGAKLTGSLEPDGTDVHYYFEYGTCTSAKANAKICSSEPYGSIGPALPGTDAGSGGAKCTPPGGVECSAVAADATLSGLQANTIYHYRLVGVDSFGTTHGEDESLLTPGPPAIGGESAEVKSTEKAGQTTAKLLASVKPDGRETTYSFEYGETKSYGTSVPTPPGVVGSGVLEAELTGLKIGTTYHYRVVASNEYGTVDGPDQTFTTTPAILVEGSVSDVTATSATLSAQINPLGSDTHYYFQYGSASCATGPASCASVPAPPGTDIGGGEGLLGVSAHLQNLTPATTYHFRVVAANALGETVEAPDQTFTTQAVSAFALPDGRQYEMVSPPHKRGALIEALNGVTAGAIQADVEGNAFTYIANGPTEAEPQGYANQLQVLSTRGPEGWSSRDIAIPHAAATAAAVAGPGSEYQFFSEDLSLGVVQPLGGFDPAVSAEASEQTPYLHTDFVGGNVGDVCTQSCYRPLLTGKQPFADVTSGVPFSTAASACPQLNGAKSYQICAPEFVNATPDGKHVLLATQVHKGGVEYGAALTAFPGDEGGLYEWSGDAPPAQRLVLVSVLPDGKAIRWEVGNPSGMSEDGSLVFFTLVNPAVPGESRVYMRDVSRGETIELGGLGASFEGVFAGGSRVLVSGQVCEVRVGVGGKVECPVVVGGTGPGASLVGASKDGSVLYFTSAEVLTGSEMNDRRETARSGEPNLYVRHGAAPPRFIAVVALEGARVKIHYGSEPTSRVSPDGGWLTFMSDRSLTGYDTRDARSGKPDVEVYLYDDASGSLVCASCDPTGARPSGSSSVPVLTHVSEGLALYQSRYLSDNGRLFFDSNDALVPQDINGMGDVYEYEPVGTGDCSSSSVTYNAGSGGCVGLISSGASAEESSFMDASENGRDVFFLTQEKLLPQDFDTAPDVYDARECTSVSPCLPVAATQPPPCVTGDSCKPSPAIQPEIFGPSGSATFSGAGNVTASGSAPPVTSKSVSRAQKLARALKACRKKPKKKRAVCEKQARKSYGAKASRAGKSGKANSSRKGG
jgi:DNA-binding beta-propeller fold protein YncE